MWLHALPPILLLPDAKPFKNSQRRVIIFWQSYNTLLIADTFTNPISYLPPPTKKRYVQRHSRLATVR